tara:strand:- start:2862 stop:3200 length:339 start_codon:yes stop_codon:yes gene_type:complete
MWKPILVYTVTFVTLFVAHIIAAANDLDLLFRIIASIITIQTMFAGLVLHFLKGDARHARYPVVALSAGLGWAYAGMSLHWMILLWVIGAILLQYGTEKGLKYDRLAHEHDG